MLLAMVASTVLVMLTVLIHYEILRLLTDWLPNLRIPPRSKLLFVIAGSFLAHTIEVWLYALALYLLAFDTALGRLSGEFAGAFPEYLYFSTVTYTSLGFGDVWPVGALRLITGVESLNGLVLIGWTASYTYLAMREFWDLHPKRRHRQ